MMIETEYTSGGDVLAIIIESLTLRSKSFMLSSASRRKRSTALGTEWLQHDTLVVNEIIS